METLTISAKNAEFDMQFQSLIKFAMNSRNKNQFPVALEWKLWLV